MEMMNQTIIEKVRCMLSTSILLKSFWGYVALTACYLINRSSSWEIVKKTLVELWYKIPTNYTNLKPFGCPAYGRFDNERLELSAISFFISYNLGIKGYKLWSFDSKKVIMSRDVTFNEFDMIQEVLDSSKRIDASSEASK